MNLEPNAIDESMLPVGFSDSCHLAIPNEQLSHRGNILPSKTATCHKGICYLAKQLCIGCGTSRHVAFLNGHLSHNHYLKKITMCRPLNRPSYWFTTMFN